MVIWEYQPRHGNSNPNAVIASKSCIFNIKNHTSRPGASPTRVGRQSYSAVWYSSYQQQRVLSDFGAERGGEIAWRFGELEDGAEGGEDHLRLFDYFDGLLNPVQC